MVFLFDKECHHNADTLNLAPNLIATSVNIGNATKPEQNAERTVSPCR